MRISARNQLKGTIVEVEEGAVNGIVTIEIPCGCKIKASITNAAIHDLQRGHCDSQSEFRHVRN